MAQETDQNQMVRLVKIEVDPDSLAVYILMLKEQMNTAIRLEEGVMEYHVVSEKDKPYIFTLIEIYKDRASYLSHLNTAHFLKYKTATKNMVKSLELIDANLIARVTK